MKSRNLLGLFSLLALLLILTAGAAVAAAPLTVLSAGPEGEIASLEEANEVRVVFSEPMVVLGRIPQPLRAPFFSITPPVAGTFRWSGTTTLLFTPDPKKKLPYSTKFNVKIDASATAVSGAKLAAPYTFSFTTPTVRLRSTTWYRKNGRYDGALVIVLRFNQAVDKKKFGEFLRLKYVPHDWSAPAIPAAGLERLEKEDPASIDAFNAKVAKTRKATQAGGTVMGFFADNWNKERFPPSNDMIVFETQPGIPTDSWVDVVIDPDVRGAQGAESAGIDQHFTIQLERTFFVRGDLENGQQRTGFNCIEECDPDYWNPLAFTRPALLASLRKTLTVRDVTNSAKDTVVKPGESDQSEDESAQYVSLEDLGYQQTPARKFAVKVDKETKARDGQTLGYTWIGVVDFWHRVAFSSFGDGHGVWESSGGPVLPFYARNLKNVTQWLAPVAADDVMPTVVRLENAYFNEAPEVKPVNRKLAPKPDEIQSYGIDLSGVLGERKTGVVWAAVQDGDAIARAHQSPDARTVATVVQVTNLGISVKDSPQNTLIFVTALDTGKPVAGANVAIRTLDNKVFWQGTTGADGIAMASNTDLRKGSQSGGGEGSDDESWYDYWKLKFIVTAEKDGDFAYTASNWNEGVLPWDFGQELNLQESQPLLRGTVFTDRGVYKLGEEVHLKAIVRSDTPNGIKLFPAGTELDVVVTDSRDNEVDSETLKLSDWSSVDWAFTIPDDGSLGNYTISAMVAGQRGEAAGDFLVAAYRRPDFRVDAKLTGEPALAGTRLNGTINGRYLFGGTMSGRDVKWTYTKTATLQLPDAVRDTLPEYKLVFLGWDPEVTVDTSTQTISSNETKLDSKGVLALDLDTTLTAGLPYVYTLEGEVTDLSRQKIAGRASLIVHPAPWYVGVQAPPYFADAAQGVDTSFVAVTPSGVVTPGVKVDVKLFRVQWNSVRRAEGNGFYTWETERKLIDAGSWDITTAVTPAPLHVDVKNGGYYIIRATATDDAGRSTTTTTSFYVLGSGYSAWERYDHNRIDLVPEKKTYKPGDTARIMIKSPWESATALLTTEREGVRTHKQFNLTSTQQTIEVPVTENDIPNVFVSVLLVKGRTDQAKDDDPSDPGKPAFRLGYVELKVEDATKKLNVAVKANKEEYRPASKAKIEVNVNDYRNRPAQTEVTLWAVDYGVLSLTGYKTPDVIDSIYIEKAIQVLNEDSRQKIISRRVLTPKGAGEGGGGGFDNGPGTVRKDFRVLAFWLGSVRTNKKGTAKVDVTLPESLTTYRIMAVAGDRDNRFGWGEREIRTNKPVMLEPAFPRFLALGDTAHFGSVVHSQLGQKGTATVTMRSLDPGILEVVGDTRQSVDIDANGSAEVRFDAITKTVGNARVEMTVKMKGETDAFQDVVPVRILVSPETVAAYGTAAPDAKEMLELPAGVVPDFGGLHLELSSTAMVGLADGARYLVEYPYGCAEQRSSRTLAISLASDLGGAFKIPGIDPSKLRDVAQTNLDELEKFQCSDGGFTYWAGDCWMSSPYLTSYVLHVYQRGQMLGYDVDKTVLDDAYSYLDTQLGKDQPVNEGWWPAYTAWQSFAVKVLTEGGKNEDSHITRLYGYRERMPLFALAYLVDAMNAKGEKSGARIDDLRRRMRNAILVEGGSAHVEELADPYLLLFWNSNVRSTAIVLRTLVDNSSDPTVIRGMVRWLMNARKKGRWGNTQENALAMEALVDYYRKFESEEPDFVGTATLGTKQLDREEFKGRSTEAKSTDVAMPQILSKGQPGETLDLTFHREGTGTLFYLTRLRYAANELFQRGLDAGFAIERKYYAVDTAALGASALSGAEKNEKPATTFKAGDLVRIVLEFNLPKERTWVAVTDPLPAGFEPVESWFATTATDLVKAQEDDGGEAGDWMSWFRRGGFDHVERHDDRVQLFATRLAEGPHTFSYLARATTAGTFRTAPTHAEEMYEPEVFGRTATDVIEVQK